ncbi:DASH complex subunit Dad3-domain-containing protein, partial [Kalaharituber pfeilii]
MSMIPVTYRYGSGRATVRICASSEVYLTHRPGSGIEPWGPQIFYIRYSPPPSRHIQSRRDSHIIHTNMSTHHSLTPLEQDLLDEYTRLLANMNQLASSISSLATSPTPQLLDSLRELERKSGLVFTLLKASVYSIVLQQELEGGIGGGGAGSGAEGHGGEDSGGDGE